MKSGDGDVKFKVKKETPFIKLFSAYANKRGGDIDTFRFTFNGDRIKPESTAESLNLEDGCEIAVSMDAIGGMNTIGGTKIFIS